MSLLSAKNLDPQRPGKAIVESKLPHVDLILSWPWNQVKREDLRLRVSVRGEREGARARAGSGEGESGEKRE